MMERTADEATDGEVDDPLRKRKRDNQQPQTEASTHTPTESKKSPPNVSSEVARIKTGTNSHSTTLDRHTTSASAHSATHLAEDGEAETKAFHPSEAPASSAPTIISQTISSSSLPSSFATAAKALQALRDGGGGGSGASGAGAAKDEKHNNTNNDREPQKSRNTRGDDHTNNNDEDGGGGERDNPDLERERDKERRREKETEKERDRDRDSRDRVSSGKRTRSSEEGSHQKVRREEKESKASPRGGGSGGGGKKQRRSHATRLVIDDEPEEDGKKEMEWEKERERERNGKRGHERRGNAGVGGGGGGGETEREYPQQQLQRQLQHEQQFQEHRVHQQQSPRMSSSSHRRHAHGGSAGGGEEVSGAGSSSERGSFDDEYSGAGRSGRGGGGGSGGGHGGVHKGEFDGVSSSGAASSSSSSMVRSPLSSDLSHTISGASGGDGHHGGDHGDGGGGGGGMGSGGYPYSATERFDLYGGGGDEGNNNNRTGSSFMSDHPLSSSSHSASAAASASSSDHHHSSLMSRGGASLSTILNAQDDPTVQEAYALLSQMQDVYEKMVNWVERRLQCGRDEQERSERRLRREWKMLEDDRQRWEDEKEQMAQVHQFASNKVRLNIGGQGFETTRATLLKDPQSMLARMFSGRFEVVKDEEGSIFLDRDPSVFSHILNFLRNNEISVSPREEGVLWKLLEEARFYGIEGLIEAVKDKLGMRYSWTADWEGVCRSEERFYQSPIFIIGGWPWRLSLVRDEGWLGISLTVSKKARVLPKGWRCCASFAVELRNSNIVMRHNDAQLDESRTGIFWRHCYELSKLVTDGIVAEGKLIVRAEIKIDSCTLFT